jgi:hypothetical protein
VDAQKTPLEKMQELLLITITNRVE